MNDLSTSINMARANGMPTRKPALGWSEVLRAVQSEETRQRVTGALRTAGFTPDDFGRLRAARIAVADGLTAAEDWLELARPRSSERLAPRDVRRRLELELWP